METVLFKSNSKKDMNLIVTLAKKIGIEVQKISSQNNELDENSPEYELKVERNLGKMMDKSKNSPKVSEHEVLKILNKWK